MKTKIITNIYVPLTFCYESHISIGNNWCQRLFIITSKRLLLWNDESNHDKYIAEYNIISDINNEKRLKVLHQFTFKFVITTCFFRSNKMPCAYSGKKRYTDNQLTTTYQTKIVLLICTFLWKSVTQQAHIKSKILNGIR